jgi:hypothetical protein
MVQLPELRFFDFLAESSACDSSAIIVDMATPSAIEIGNLTGKWIIVRVDIGSTKVLKR